MIVGDALGNFRLFVPMPLALALTAAAVAGLFSGRRALGLLLALAALIGLSNLAAHRVVAPQRGPAGLHRFADGARIAIEGFIVRPVEHYPGRDHLYVRVERAGANPWRFKPAHGLIRVTVLHPRGYRIGDEIAAASRIKFPRNFGNPGAFDYAGYLARLRVDATMVVAPKARGEWVEVVGHRDRFPASLIETVRSRIGAFIDRNLPHTEAAEMRALIIGDRGGISDALRQRFALTGMAHLLVISGLHLSFVAAAAFFLVRLLMMLFPGLAGLGYANKAAALAAIVAVGAYASIAGHHISTERALIMVAAYMVAIMIDRSHEVMASLFLAALVICLLLPGSTADISFQLSFVVVAVIILGMRRFAAFMRRHGPALFGARAARSRWRRAAWWSIELLAGYVAVSFWAMVGAAPLTAFHFNQFALVGLVANAVVVPIMGFGGTTLGLAAAALSFLWQPAAVVVLRAAGALLGAGTFLAGWFMTWPAAWFHVFTPTLLELAIAYGFLAIWLTLPIRDEKTAAHAMRAAREAGGLKFARRFSLRTACVTALIILLVADAGWWSYERFFYPGLRVTFLSVGEGDAAVVRFPGGRVMLIDGGGSFLPEFDPGQRIVAPYLWSRKIMHVDYLALSHPELDHFGGFGFIERNFSPTAFWATDASSPDASYLKLLIEIMRRGTRLRRMDTSAQPLTIGGVTVRCLNPAPGLLDQTRNNRSMVLRLSYGPDSLLFAGDLEKKGERAMLARGGDLSAAVLKVPHHGSATSSSSGFIAAVHPKLAVISLGYMNRFHFPAAAVLKRYRAAGVKVLRTDLDGAVTVEVDAGGRLSARSYLGGPLPLAPSRPAR